MPPRLSRAIPIPVGAAARTGGSCRAVAHLPPLTEGFDTPDTLQDWPECLLQADRSARRGFSRGRAYHQDQPSRAAATLGCSAAMVSTRQERGRFCDHRQAFRVADPQGGARDTARSSPRDRRGRAAHRGGPGVGLQRLSRRLPDGRRVPGLPTPTRTRSGPRPSMRAWRETASRSTTGPGARAASATRATTTPRRQSRSRAPGPGPIRYLYPTDVAADGGAFSEAMVGCSTCHYGDAASTQHAAPASALANADICGQCHAVNGSSKPPNDTYPLASPTPAAS